MYLVYQFDGADDPALLSETLWRLKIPHQVSYEQGQQTLLIANPNHETAVHQLIQMWQENPESLRQVKRNPPAKGTQQAGGLMSQVKAAPATFLVLLVSAIVAMITQLGSDLSTLSYFTISPLDVMGSQIRFYPLTEVLARGEYWRLITPAFLHFSVMHIAFNALWVWDVGKRLERAVGSVVWLIGVLIMAIASNVLQFEIASSPLFGGLSGVVYGLIGFAWLMPLLNRRWPVIISKPLMIFFIVWLGIGYTSFTEMIGLGSIANTAHSIGLVSGLVLALVYWAVTKLSPLKPN